jgi:hypothetical protein
MSAATRRTPEASPHPEELPSGQLAGNEPDPAARPAGVDVLPQGAGIRDRAEAPADQQWNYREVRGRLRTGDLLLFRGSHPLSRLIQLATGSRYSHAGLLTWWSPLDAPTVSRLMVLEATHPYVTLRPASESVGAYRGTVDWYPLQERFRARLDETRLLQEATERLGLEFSVGGLFDNLWARLGLQQLAATRRSRSRFCSEYVSECMTMALEDPVVSCPDHFTSPEALSQSSLWHPAGRLILSRQQRAHHRAQTREAQRLRAQEKLRALGSSQA